MFQDDSKYNYGCFMSNKKTTINVFFDEVWSRIKIETPIKNMVELAQVAGTTQQNVSKKKKENFFPVEWAYCVGREYGLLTEWIMTGEGPKRKDEIGENAATIKSLMSSYLEGAVNALRTIEQKDSVAFISCLNKINTELQRIEEREKEAEGKSIANGTTG